MGSLVEIRRQELPRSVCAMGRESLLRGHMNTALHVNMLAMEPIVTAPCNALECAMAKSSLDMHLPIVGLAGRRLLAHSLAWVEHLVAIQHRTKPRNASAWAPTRPNAHLSSAQLVKILATDPSVIVLLDELAPASVR